MPLLQINKFNIFSYHVQVAVKKMKRKFYHWEECISLREVKVIILFLVMGISPDVIKRDYFAFWILNREAYPPAGPPETKPP